MVLSLAVHTVENEFLMVDFKAEVLAKLDSVMGRPESGHPNYVRGINMLWSVSFVGN